MNIRFSIPVSLTHRHDDVDVGPESRPHAHDCIVTVFIGSLGFDPASGKVVDPRLGPMSFGEIQKLLFALSARYDGKNLDEILGIRPTFPSLALSIRERYLLTWPDVQVSIRCPDEGWEVQT